MAKVKVGKFEVDEEELERQHRLAVRRGRESMKSEPSAVGAYYDARADRIVVELNNGCSFIFPPELAQGLRGASRSDLAEIEVMPTGYALRWPRLDADFTVTGLLAGIFGTRAWMAELARRGGDAGCETKAAASREGVKKAGRQRRKTA
jgi:hypothetical protein